MRLRLSASQGSRHYVTAVVLMQRCFYSSSSAACVMFFSVAVTLLGFSIFCTPLHSLNNPPDVRLLQILLRLFAPPLYDKMLDSVTSTLRMILFALLRWYLRQKLPDVMLPHPCLCYFALLNRSLFLFFPPEWLSTWRAASVGGGSFPLEEVVISLWMSSCRSSLGHSCLLQMTSLTVR